VTTDTPSVNDSTQASMPIRASRQAGLAPLTQRLDAQNASNKPKPPPARESSTLSVSNWRATRSRPAPSATRTAISRCRAAARREQEVGDVRAGDEQDKRDRAQQHEQRPLHVADDLLVQADQGQNTLALALALALAAPSRRRSPWLNTLRDCSQLGLRLLERHTGFNRAIAFRNLTPPASVRSLMPLHLFHQRQRNPKLKPFWILKARRKNAHDGVTLLVQRDRPVQHGRSPPNRSAEAVSENDRL